VGAVSQVLTPMGALARAARRPASYSGQLREVTSTVVMLTMLPLGLADRGRAGFPGKAHSSPVTTPVLLVHGFGANKSNWTFVTRSLADAGFLRVHALNYNPLTAGLPELAQQCADRADELKSHFGVDRVHIIGHSLGGVIARYAIQVLGLDGVSVCATVAAPHAGLGSARPGVPTERSGPLLVARQLRSDSEVMARLRSTARPSGAQFVAYYSNLDVIVPAHRAKIHESELSATNILIKDHGHLSIMLSRQLSASLVDVLTTAEGRWSRPGAVGPPISVDPIAVT
jgi:triacylglycerol lipase